MGHLSKLTYNIFSKSTLNFLNLLFIDHIAPAQVILDLSVDTLLLEHGHDIVVEGLVALVLNLHLLVQLLQSLALPFIIK